MQVERWAIWRHHKLGHSSLTPNRFFIFFLHLINLTDGFSITLWRNVLLLLLFLMLIVFFLFHSCLKKKKRIHSDTQVSERYSDLSARNTGEEQLVPHRLSTVHTLPLEGDKHQCYHTEVGSVWGGKKKQKHKNILLSLAITRPSSIIRHGYTSISFS